MREEDWKQILGEAQGLSTKPSLAELLQAKDRYCALEWEIVVSVAGPDTCVCMEACMASLQGLLEDFVLEATCQSGRDPHARPPQDHLEGELGWNVGHLMGGGGMNFMLYMSF